MRTTLLLMFVAVAGCKGADKPAAKPQGGSRFDSVQAAPSKAQDSFCEKTYPAQGHGSRKYEAPADQPLPATAAPAAPVAEKHWKYVNLWATWCQPCMAEMGLFARWRDAFASDGVPVSFELLSIDASDAADALASRVSKGLPGNVRWVKSSEALHPLLDALGVERTAAIPIHALVDPEGMIRCVRVGAIHAEDYPAVKALIGG